jgi:membrane protease YdiL (CAAX protease family)
VSARSFWGRVATATLLAVSLGLALSPPQPRARLSTAAATAFGAAAGIVLFTVAVRRPPAIAHLGAGAALVSRQLFLGLCAANEEVLWRRVLLGELLPAGGLAALAVSSAGFAAAHRRARPLHGLTGLTFGGIYLATGVLTASIAAHWAYNAFVGSLAERRPP